MSPITKQLQAMRLHNSDACKVFDALRTYTNHVKEITVDTLRMKTKLSPSAIRAVLRELQELELGELKTGRRGYSTRFVWLEPFTEIVPGPVKGEPKKGNTLGLANGSAMTQWVCKLGPRRDATLLLPANLTQADLKVVRAFLERTLGQTA